MDLRQLQYFVAAAKAEHFTRASRQLNVAQSALSSAIKSLEEELRTQLFVRSTRKVRLTLAGKAFLEKAVVVLDAAEDARQTVHDVTHSNGGKLSIGTVQGLPAFLDLPALLAEFHDLYGRVEVRLIQGGADHLLEKLRKGIIDLAFLPVTEPTSSIVTTMVACEDLVLICAVDHPAAALNNITLPAISQFLFVDFQPDWGTRKLIDDAFHSAGLTRKTAFEVSDLNTLFDLVSRGLGIALVPESVAHSYGPTISIRNVSQVEICWEVIVARLPGELPEAAPTRFLTLLETKRQASHER
ncbi:LysR family transcriptional regulator [Phyllobacterium sp. SB3]|uniref:LysR family transcriptional regulator n=1 Tax=Phyllobacterium sp. SB3 TaxID=3156073 RepID=UPI0032AE8FD1